MFGLSNSKKTLAMSSILLLSVHVLGSDSSSGFAYTTCQDIEARAYQEMPIQGKGCFRGFVKILWDNKYKTLGVFVLFVLAMVAMFQDFTEIDNRFGKNIFGDKGASLWLRLAVAIPCLSFTVGAFVLVCCRAKKRGEFLTSEDYRAWKAETGSHHTKYSQILQYIFWSGLIIFAIVAATVGGLTGDWGKTAHILAWCLPLCAGISGLTFAIMRSRHQKSEKKHSNAYAEIDSHNQKLQRDVADKELDYLKLKKEKDGLENENTIFRKDFMTKTQTINDLREQIQALEKQHSTQIPKKADKKAQALAGLGYKNKQNKRISGRRGTGTHS